MSQCHLVRSLVGALLTASVALAEGPYLVKDINTLPAAAELGPPLRVGDVAFFTLQRDTYLELWKTDGSAAGTVHVHMLCADGCAPPRYMIASGDRVFFDLSDRLTGRELWTSDGTPGGTRLVADIAPGEASSDLGGFWDAAGRLFFLVHDELWISDGSAAGTILVKDFSDVGTVGPFLAAGTLLYFVVKEPALALWQSDGSEAGTVRLVVLPEGSESFRSPVETAGVLYFELDGDDSGSELWRSDGTAAGTWRVKDINPGTLSSSPSALAVAGGTLFFVADDGTHGREPWKSDGTEAGTLRIADVCPGACDSAFPVWGGYSPALPVFGDTYLFLADDGTTGEELWRSDGSEAGTELLADIAPGAASSDVHNLTVDGGRMFFHADDQLTGDELWTSDGSTAGTRLAWDLCPGPAGAHWDPFQEICVLGAKALVAPSERFSCADSFAGQLWSSDGSGAGTALVRGFESVFATRGSGPSELTVLGHRVLFAADDGGFGSELWTSDASTAGTRLVSDIEPGPAGSTPSRLIESGGRVFFHASTSASGRELWASDGSESGTVLVADICPGPCDGIVAYPREAMVVMGSALYFAASDGSSGIELWRSDGTLEGTSQVSDIAPGPPGSMTRALVAAGDTLFFRAADDLHGLELWKTDGSEAGTELVADICPGPCSTFYDPVWEVEVSHASALGHILYFPAGMGSDAGIQLWRSDGSAEGTRRVLDTPLGEPHQLTVAGDRLFFGAGAQIWSSDGSGPGTFPVFDGYTSSPLVASGDFVYFYGDSALRRSDGTLEATVALRELPSWSDSIWEIVDFHGQALILFSRDADFELWLSDAESGTRVISSFHLDGDYRMKRPYDLTPLLGRAVFSMGDDSLGWELWAADIDLPRMLRNDRVTALDPVTPALASLFPFIGARDSIGHVSSGELDSDAGLLADGGRPLVFYQLEGLARLFLIKTDDRRIQLRYTR